MHYVRVKSVDDLLRGLAEPGAVILCGGTDLIVKMRAGLLSPETLLDISELDDLRAIDVTDGAVEIGAAVTEEELLQSEIVVKRLPLLADVLRDLGSPQIRNRGTLGGNLVNASPAADSAIPLLLYDADVVLRSADGERSIPAERFMVGPGKTCLGPREFVRAIRIPLPKWPFETSFHKVGKRRALTIAIASVGALLHIEEGRIVEARLAAGSVAPVPLRLRELETKLQGATLDDTLIEETRTAARDAVSPITDVRATADYRRDVVGDLVARALRLGSRPRSK